MLKLLKRRFGITEATFSFDGVMSAEINLQAMTQAGLNYVTRLGKGEFVATRFSVMAGFTGFPAPRPGTSG